MTKRFEGFYRVTSLMVGMAVPAGIRAEFSMKEGFSAFCLHRGAGYAFQSDVSGLVARNALYRCCALERLVAAQAILFQMAVSLEERARIEKHIRKRKNECCKEYGRKDENVHRFHDLSSS